MSVTVATDIGQYSPTMKSDTISHSSSHNFHINTALEHHSFIRLQIIPHVCRGTGLFANFVRGKLYEYP